MPGIRHFGMEPDDFQLETVVGARSSATATATVPPSASIMSDAVSMRRNYDNRNFGASGKVTMSVIDGGVRFSQCRAMVTHEEILAELIRWLDAKKVTGKGLADLLGIAPARITEMKKGDRRIQQDEMAVLAEFFGLGNADAQSSQGNVVWVPVIGIAAAGAWRDAIEVPSFMIAQSKRAGVNQAFAVIVDGDSMNQILPERSYAIIDPDQKRLVNRKVYLIGNGGGEATIKRYCDNPARFEPASNNPDHTPIYVGESEIRVIGRVVSFHSDEGL